MQNSLFREQHQIVLAAVPSDTAAAALNGDWVSLKNFNHVTILFAHGIGSGSEDPVLTIQQASKVDGTGAKALNFTKYGKKSHATDITTVGQFTETSQAAGNTLTGEGNAQELFAVEFDAADLDVDGGFDCIRATVADVGVTAQLAAIVYILSEPRYSGNPPSAMAD